MTTEEAVAFVSKLREIMFDYKARREAGESRGIPIEYRIIFAFEEAEKELALDKAAEAERDIDKAIYAPHR